MEISTEEYYEDTLIEENEDLEINISFKQGFIGIASNPDSAPIMISLRQFSEIIKELEK